MYYYRPYQEAYWTAPVKFMALFSEEDFKLLCSNAHSLGWYWDSPNYLENPNLCRSLFGFAMDPDKLTPKIAAVFEKAGLLRAELPAWKGVEASLRVISELSYGVAAMKLIPPICEYVEKNYPEMYTNTPMYEFCTENHSTYGCVISENQGFFEQMKPYPDPKLNEMGAKEMAKLRKKEL